MSTAAARKPDKARYPNITKVRTFVKLARELGIDVAGFEVSPDGAIRIVEARASPDVMTDFDRYKDEL
mgnify:CR=1 FL=1|jgi:hypothetical protein